MVEEMTIEEQLKRAKELQASTEMQVSTFLAQKLRAERELEECRQENAKLRNQLKDSNDSRIALSQILEEKKKK